MRFRRIPLLALLLLLLCSACEPSRYLANDEYMLTKNAVKVVDKKGVEFDDLYYTVRPITNKKFLDVYPLKAAQYVNNLPRTDSLGNVVKDTKLMQKRRANGEEPVLLDTTLITYSLDQINIAMKNLGYFNARSWSRITYKGPTKSHPKRHKAEVTYFVEANEPYFIRDIQYHIDIYEYRRIIQKDTVNTLIHRGEKYNAETLLEERNRIVNNIRDQGYYYVSTDIVSFQIDTLKSHQFKDEKGNPTLVVHIYVNFNRIKDKTIQEKHAYKYYFNSVYIYPNYKPAQDTVSRPVWSNYHKKHDETNYLIFIDREAEKHYDAKDKPIRDIRPRILTDNILTKKGETFSQTMLTRSRKKLNDLRNFSYLDVSVVENPALRDTVNKIGYLNTYYRLTRNKLHSLAAEFEARSDRTSLSLTYSNKNLFRSAEFFNINVYGSLGFRIRTKSAEQAGGFTLESQAVGGEVSMDFRRLLFFRKTQKIEALNYGTSLKVGAHFENTYLYRRGLYNAALVYNFSYSAKMTHSISPIDLSVIDITTKGEEFEEVISLYSKDFREKYKDNFLLSFKYGFTYTHPTKDPRNSFIIRFKAESSGMFLSSICAMAKAPKDDKGHYTIFGTNYGNYELAEVDLRFTHTINKKNSVATRFDFGIGIPLWNASTLPFEKSFYLGGSNSMRAWDYRTLGPGSYYNQNDEDLVNDIRTGDLKLEMNIEYRGTLYKFIKYGIFVDAGNIWLTHKDEEMPNAEFNFNRFYKEIGFGVGAGLRFDFNFFIIRVDAALAIFDPSKAPDNRWIQSVVNDKGRHVLNRSVNIIFGIGHAF